MTFDNCLSIYRLFFWMAFPRIDRTFFGRLQSQIFSYNIIYNWSWVSEEPNFGLQTPSESLRLLSLFNYIPHSILSAWTFWSYARSLKICEQWPTAEVKWDEKLKWRTLYIQSVWDHPYPHHSYLENRAFLEKNFRQKLWGSKWPIQ